MRRCFLSICIAISLVGHATAVEFTRTLIPQLADVHAARLFVYTSSGGSCDLPKDEMLAVVRETLAAADMQSVDGFDPSQPSWPILEIYVGALDLLANCYLTAKIVLRTDVTGAKVEGNHYYEYEMVWGDADSYMCTPIGLVDQASGLLRAKLRLMTDAIQRARMTFPKL